MDPEGIHTEVRFLIDTFDRPDGGMAIAAGNGIVSGTPFENIDAFLDASLERYERLFVNTGENQHDRVLPAAAKDLRDVAHAQDDDAWWPFDGPHHLSEFVRRSEEEWSVHLVHLDTFRHMSA